MSVVAELCDLLDEERKLLLRGDIDGVERLIELKLVLMARLSEKDDLGAVQDRLEYNATLFKAAMRGIRQAKTQIMQARTGGPGRQTYGPDGARSDLCATNQVEQRY